VSLARDIEQTYERFGVYIDQLTSVMTKYGVSGTGWRSYRKLVDVLRNKQAREEIGSLLKAVAAFDGGKLGMSAVGLVIAIAIGGVGVAALGTAFGLSSAFVAALGALGGGLIGNEIDGVRWTKHFLVKGLKPDNYLESSTEVGPPSDGNLTEGEVINPHPTEELHHGRNLAQAISRLEIDVSEIKASMQSSHSLFDLKTESLQVHLSRLEGSTTAVSMLLSAGFAEQREMTSRLLASLLCNQADLMSKQETVNRSLAEQHLLQVETMSRDLNKKIRRLSIIFFAMSLIIVAIIFARMAHLHAY
jgi:hypothetical protein